LLQKTPPLRSREVSDGQGQRGESFNGNLRDECLKLEIFYSLKEAKVVIGAWKDHYSRVRPHSSLSYRPPAPAAVASSTSQLPEATMLQ
jgi:transposase InsO family protein